jgi:hypothetical protein
MDVDESCLQFVSGDSVFEDLSLAIWSIGDSVGFLLRERDQAFVFEDRKLNLKIKSDLPFSQLQSFLCREFGIESGISIFLDRAEVDLDMTSSDLNLSPDQVLRIERAASGPLVLAATETYSVALWIGVVPRMASFKLAPTSTLADAEPMVRNRWCLGELEIEFGVLDEDSDIPAVIPKSTVIGGLDLDKYTLIVRPSANIDSAGPVVSGYDEPDGDIEEDENAGDGRLLQSMQATVGSAEPGAVRYGFVCDDQVFHIRFPPGAKVGDARKAVAQRFKTTPEAVALHFMGKALRDGFAMDRLRLGTSHISVYVTSDREILVVTARANRT